MSAYFSYCKTEKDIKSEYRRLAFIHHPDKGGRVNAFLNLKEQYERSMAAIGQFHQRSAYTYTPNDWPSSFSPTYEYRTVINVHRIHLKSLIKKIRRVIKAGEIHDFATTKIFIKKNYYGRWNMRVKLVLKLECDNRIWLEHKIRMLKMYINDNYY